MRLIANKPCSFGGRQFYIGDEIPADLVADARAQEKMGVIAIANDAQRVSSVLHEEKFSSESTVVIPVKGDSAGDSEQQTKILATVEEIQQVFSIMQMNATDGAEAIAGVKSENVLILLHAADARKTIKDAAKKQADNIFSTSGNPNESAGGNAITGTDTEGADT